MAHQLDDLSKLYNALLGKGYTEDELGGKESDFRQFMSIPNNRRDMYDWISEQSDRPFVLGDYDQYESRLGAVYAQKSEPSPQSRVLPKPSRPLVLAPDGKTEDHERNPFSLRGALDAPIIPKQSDGRTRLKSKAGVDTSTGMTYLEPVRTPMEGVPSPIGGYVDASTGEAIAPGDPRLKDAVPAEPDAPSVDLTLDSVEHERNRLDALLRDRGRRVNEQFRQSQGGFLASLAEAVRSGHPGGVTNTIAHQTGEGVYTDEQYNTLAATKETYDNISALMREYETARRENKLDQWAVTKFGKGLGRGLSDEAAKERTWENLSSVAALSVAGKDNAYSKAVADYDAGRKLTPEQESLLEAKAKEMYAIHTLSSGTGSGYDVGSGLASTIAFMAEIAVGGGIKGAGRKAATGAARWMLEKHGIKATKGLLGKIARYGAGAIAEAGASIPTALITGSAGIASDAHRRNIGDATYQIDNNSGKIQYAGNEGGEGLGTALAKSVTARAIEHFTESAVGGMLDEAVGFIGKGARSVLAKSAAGQRLLGALDGLAKNPVAAEVGNLADRVQLNNVVSEYGEEIVAGAINALAVGDQTLDTAEGTGVFNPDNLIDTAISVALVSGAFGSAGAVGYRTPRARAKQAMLNSSRSVLAQFPDPSIHASIVSAIDNGNTEQVRNLLSSVSTDPEMTEGQRRAVLNYAKDALYYRSAYNASKRDEDDVIAISRDNYENGYGLSDAQELNNARVNYEYRRRKLAEAMGIPPEQAQGILFDDPARAINVLSTDGSLTDDQRERAIAYLNAKAKYDGVVDRVQDDIDDSVSQASERIEANTHDSGRMIKATLRDGGQVYIKSGNIVMTDDGSMVNTSASDQEIFVVDAETGKVSMTSPSNISSIDEDVDAVEYRAQIEGEISSSIAGERANMIEGAVIPVKGDSYTLADGDGNNMTALVAEVFPDGSLVVQHEDGSLMPLTAESFQDMARAAQQAQIEASLDEADQADAQAAQYTIGDVVGLSLEDGTQVEAEVVEEADADGRIGVLMTMPDGTQVMSSLSADQMRTMATTQSESVEEGGSSVSEADNTTPEQPSRQESKSPEETEWDSLIEQAEGDKDTARMTAEAMVANMRDEVARAEKELSKKTKGKTPQEVMQEVKERKYALDEAKQSLSYWEAVASVEAAREAQAKAEAQAEARAKAEAEAEIERKAREEFAGVPDWSNDTAQDARARGYRRNVSERIDRNGIVGGVSGSEVNIRFSNDRSVSGRYMAIEASELQPSHIQGARNPRFFLDEAQPKDRSDEVSAVSAQRIATSIRPEEITSATTAYTGAPVVNSLGEVIQGNNRGDALRYMYESTPEQADVYRRYIEEHASDFGLDVNALGGMSNPVLVRVADVPDADAIELGQYTSQDTESGGVERIKPEHTLRKLGDKMPVFADMLLSSADADDSIGELIRSNGAEVLSWLNRGGYISDTQLSSAFNAKGGLTDDAASDLRGVLQQALFASAPTTIKEAFSALPAKAQRAILATAHRDLNSEASGSIIIEVRDSIMVFAELQSKSSAFANAKTTVDAMGAIRQWLIQQEFDPETGETFLPNDRLGYSNFALTMAAMYKGATQRFIQQTYNDLYDHIQGAGLDLFDPSASDPKSIAESVKTVLNIDYNNGQIGSDPASGATQESQAGGRGSDADARGDEQGEGGGRKAKRSRGARRNDSKRVGDAQSSQNRLVSQERYDELRERLKKKLLGQANMGIDPEILTIGLEMSVYHIENGVYKFADYAKAMIGDIGDAVRPYLKAFYNGARDLPEVSANGWSDSMDSYDDVRLFDVANFDKPAVDAMATAEQVVAEQEVERQEKQAKETLRKSRSRKAVQKEAKGHKAEDVQIVDVDDTRTDLERDYERLDAILRMAYEDDGNSIDKVKLFKDLVGEHYDEKTGRGYLLGESIIPIVNANKVSDIERAMTSLVHLMDDEELHSITSYAFPYSDGIDGESSLRHEAVANIIRLENKNRSMDDDAADKESVSLKSDDAPAANEVYAEGLFGALYDNGEAKLSDHHIKEANEDEVQGLEERALEGGRAGHSALEAEPLGRSERDSLEHSEQVGVDRGSVGSPSDDGERGRGVPDEPVDEPRNVRNNRLDRGQEVAPSTTKARYDANIEAIKKLKELEANGQVASREDMEVLRRFSGWGGLGHYFFSGDRKESPHTQDYRDRQALKELLSDEEYQAANLSRNSAYFTPVKVIDRLWDIAGIFGFKGGRVLEGSAGVGSIIGSMPESFSNKSSIQAVEIDPITGGILKLLYPDADVSIQGFEDTKIKNGSIDLAITNVPFVTGLSVHDNVDTDLSKKFRNIHDFAIAKNIRKLKQGGIGVFITSNGTLDKSASLRRWLIDPKGGASDVVGAFRLNNDTFGGTSVTSDIVVVRKRVDGVKSPNAIDVQGVSTEALIPYTEQGSDKEELRNLEYNSYFIEHPEYMGGKMAFGFQHGETFRPLSVSLYPDSMSQDELMDKWVEGLRENLKEEGVYQEAEDDSSREQTTVPEGRILIDDKGDIAISQGGEAVPLGLNKSKVKGRTKQQAVQDYLGLKGAHDALIKYQLENESDDKLGEYLSAFNKAYDDFVSRYGTLNNNLAISFLKSDADFAGLTSIEKVRANRREDGKKSYSAEKTDIFKKRILGYRSEPAPKTIDEAVTASLHKYGSINLSYISSKLGVSEDYARQDVLDKGLGFEDPVSGGIESRYSYLSGNVREKLSLAKSNNDGARYSSNIEALESVLPMDIPPHLIRYNLGTSWIPGEVYSDFFEDKFGVKIDSPVFVGGRWMVNENRIFNRYNDKNRSYRVSSKSLGKDMLGHEIAIKAMTGSPVVFSKTQKDYSTGKSETIHDKEATQMASQVAEDIKSEFKEWMSDKISSDESFGKRVADIYNERFNSYVPMSIDPSMYPKNGRFEGMSESITLLDHQMQGAMRSVVQPLMLAHEVGSGKTFTLISSAMEMRRLGTARKPMIVVQNSTVGQFVSSAKMLYPNAKILTIDPKDRTPEGRKAFYGKIKNSDWDIIIVAQSVFNMMPDSPIRVQAFIDERIEEKMKQLELAREGGDDSYFIVRQLENELKALERDKVKSIEKSGVDAKQEAKSKSNAEAKAKSQVSRRTDDVAYFEDMGVDALLIDEAHNYKKLGFETNAYKIKGIDKSRSQQAANLYIKTRTIFEKVGWRNVVFATGTPISNTAAELYTFMRYLLPRDVMEENGILHFDEFRKNYGEDTISLEFTTSGKFKEQTRFSSYINLPELVRLWSTCSHTQLKSDSPELSAKQPTTEEGGSKAADIFIEQTPELVDIMRAVKKELENFEKMSGKEKKANSHIPLNMFGIAQLAAIDVRLVDRKADFNPNSKTGIAIEQILKSLDETKGYNGAVALFSDKFQNAKRIEADGKPFNLFEDIRRRLIERGVPEDQIVIMRSDMNDKQKLDTFERVNSGEVRVVMGSTSTLGVGVNIQERLHTLIHLDAPIRPMDYEQRNGRILRQGNLHKDWDKPVRILRIGVKDTLDVTAYQRLKIKESFIRSVMDGGKLLNNNQDVRVLEEEDEGTFDNPVAQLSGSQYALLKQQAERDLRKYQNKLAQYEQDQKYIYRQLQENENAIKRAREDNDKLNGSLDAISKKFPSGSIGYISLGGKKYSMSELESALKDYINKPLMEEREAIRKDIGETRRTSVYPFSLDGVDGEIKVVFKRDVELKGGESLIKVSSRMTYSIPELGVLDMPVSGGHASTAFRSMADEIITGNYAKDSISENNAFIDRLSKDNEAMTLRQGRPFEFSDELSQAESRVSEYTELMRKELEDKEAKYADLGNGDSFSLDSDLLDDDDEPRFRDGEDGQSMVHLSYASRAQELGRELGVPVRVVHDIESIKYPNKSVQARMRKAKGWFDIKTGEIVVVVPNASSISDVEATIYHEAVGHKGLREVVGDKDFDAFLREVYKGLPKDAQWAVASDFLSGKYKSLEEATEEYIARLAERGFSEDRSVLRKVIDKLRDLLRNVLGVKLPFTENDLRYMLWRSYHLRQHQGAIQVAEDIAMQMNLGVGRFRDSSSSPYDAEMEQIKADAQANGTFMLAPNGKPTKLKERQWLQVRTKAFKDWFGDWEKSARIEKLRRSEPVEITGTEIEPSDDLKQYKKNALEYGKRLQGSYVNQDTGKTISLQRGRKRGGVNEVLQHDYKDAEHLQSIAAIPSIIEQAIYIDSVTNEDNKVDADSFDYYVAGVQIAGVDYTVRAVVVNTKNGETYYDHKLSSIEKGNLLDLMTGQGDNHRDFGTTPDPKSTITDISDVKDTKLVSLLRNDASKVVDENGEPLVVYHGTRELFTSFDRDYKGLNHEDIESSKAGFFFTDSIEEAEYYTERTDNDGRERSGSTPAVMPVFLSLMDPEVYSTRNDAAYELDNDAYALSYEENGSDGIIVRGRDNSVYVAFGPSQIKSATDNVGAFSSENDDIRFRDGNGGNVGQARREYNRAVRVTNADGKKVAKANIGYRLQEAYQDSMLALKKMQEAIARESGRDVESFEDAYLAENSMSSKNKVQAEKYERDFFNPLASSIAGLMDKGASYQEIKEYMYAKHGLERNEYYSRKRGGDDWDGEITDYSGLSSLTGDDMLFTDIATKMVDDFERKYDTSNLWDKVKRATRETLKISYKAGMMSRDTYESVQDMFSYYIPLRGWDEKTASSEYDYISTGMPMYSPTLKTVKGRKSLADAPIATIGFMAESAIIQGNRNRMKQRLLNLAMNTNTNLLTVQKQWYVLDNKTGEWEQASPDISEDASPDEVQQSIMAFEDRMQALANKGLAKQERNGLNVGVRALDREKKQHQVHVRVNGREYIVYVNGNPRAAQAVNGLTNPNIVGSGDSPWKWAKEKAQFVKNTMAQLFTSKNPAFIATNLARDIVWAESAVLIKENGEYARRYTKNVATMLAKGKPLSLLHKYQSGSLDESVGLEKYLDEFLTYGGETGFTQINNVDEYKKKIKRFVNDKEGWKSANGVKHARAGWHAVMGAIEFGNRAAEDLTRFAVFVTSRQMGRSIDRSISDAKEITVNFNRKGSGGYGATLAGFAYIFFNASVQSLANAGKLLSQHKGKSVALIGSVLFSAAITPFVYEAMQGLLGDDDEPSYWDIPEWVRRNNLIFYVPFSGGKYISVPLPHELRSFYGVGESAVSALLKKETIEDAMIKSAKGFADMLPLDFTGNGGSLVTNFTPTILQPLAQAYFVNKNYFGVPIYKDSQYLEDFPDWKKSYKGTNKFAVNMSKYVNELTGGDNVRKGWVDINPAIMEHMFESYLGGTGQTINQSAKTISMIWDEDARSVNTIPIINKFVRQMDERSSTGSQINRDYYKAVEELEEFERVSSGYKKEMLTAPDQSSRDEYKQKLIDHWESDQAKRRYGILHRYVNAIGSLSKSREMFLDPSNKDKIDEAIKRLKAEMLDRLEESSVDMNESR